MAIRNGGLDILVKKEINSRFLKFCFKDKIVITCSKESKNTSIPFFC